MAPHSPDTASLSQSLETLLVWRRDVRHFSQQPIADEDLNHVYQMAHLAPSVGNSQPWRFMRVLQPTLREALAVHVDETAIASGQGYQAEQQELYSSLKLHGIREAPEIIAVFSDETPRAGHRLGRVTMPETLRYSTVLAIHTLWLAVQSRGLGLGWVSILKPKFVAQLLETPHNWHFMALLCLGYAQYPSDRPELEVRGWQSRSDWQNNVLVR